MHSDEDHEEKSSDYDFNTPNPLNNHLETGNRSSSSDDANIIQKIKSFCEIDTSQQPIYNNNKQVVRDSVQPQSNSSIFMQTVIESGNKSLNIKQSANTDNNLNNNKGQKFIINNTQSSQCLKTNNTSFVYCLPKVHKKHDFYKNKCLYKYRNIKASSKLSANPKSSNISNVKQEKDLKMDYMNLKRHLEKGNGEVRSKKLKLFLSQRIETNINKDPSCLSLKELNDALYCLPDTNSYNSILSLKNSDKYNNAVSDMFAKSIADETECRLTRSKLKEDVDKNSINIKPIVKSNKKVSKTNNKSLDIKDNNIKEESKKKCIKKKAIGKVTKTESVKNTSSELKSKSNKKSVFKKPNAKSNKIMEANSESIPTNFYGKAKTSIKNDNFCKKDCSIKEIPNAKQIVAKSTHNKIVHIKNKYSELCKKIEETKTKQIKLPILSTNISAIRERYALAKRDFINNYDNVTDFQTNKDIFVPLDLTKPIPTNSSKEKKLELIKEILDKRNVEIQTSINENAKHDVSIMANISINTALCNENNEKLDTVLQNITNNNICRTDNEVICNDKENSNINSKTIHDFNIDKKIIEEIILNILETNSSIIDHQKNLLKDSIDYIIETVTKRCLQIGKTKKKANIKKNIKNKSNVTKLAPTNENIAVPTNRLDASIEQLTQTIKATLEDIFINEMVPNSQQQTITTNNSETNWSGFNNRILVTSTPKTRNNYTMQEVKELYIMRKKFNEAVENKSKENNILVKPKNTKQTTLTQTFKPRKPRLYQNADQIDEEVDNNANSLDNFCNLWKKIEEWKNNPQQFNIEYDEPQAFYPHKLIQIAISQEESNYNDLPCNQEGFNIQ